MCWPGTSPSIRRPGPPVGYSPPEFLRVLTERVVFTHLGRIAARYAPTGCRCAAPRRCRRQRRWRRVPQRHDRSPLRCGAQIPRARNRSSGSSAGLCRTGPRRRLHLGLADRRRPRVSRRDADALDATAPPACWRRRHHPAPCSTPAPAGPVAKDRQMATAIVAITGTNAERQAHVPRLTMRATRIHPGHVFITCGASRSLPVVADEGDLLQGRPLRRAIAPPVVDELPDDVIAPNCQLAASGQTSACARRPWCGVHGHGVRSLCPQHRHMIGLGVGIDYALFVIHPLAAKSRPTGAPRRMPGWSPDQHREEQSSSRA